MNYWFELPRCKNVAFICNVLSANSKMNAVYFDCILDLIFDELDCKMLDIYLTGLWLWTFKFVELIFSSKIFFSNLFSFNRRKIPSFHSYFSLKIYSNKVILLMNAASQRKIRVWWKLNLLKSIADAIWQKE